MTRLGLSFLTLLVAGAASCSPERILDRALDPVLGPCPQDLICVNGTAGYYNLEGGFWAVRGDDKVTYDPVGGLPSDFRQNGLRVHLRARDTDMGSVHMVGPVVEIISIRRLN